MEKAVDILKRESKDNTYWGLRIVQAEKSRLFTPEDKRLAKSWQTCACGKSNKHFQKDRRNVPVDSEVASLGQKFSCYINNNKFVEAAKTLVAIETS